MRFFAALRMTGTGCALQGTGGVRYKKAPLLKGAVSLKADWRIHSC